MEILEKLFYVILNLLPSLLIPALFHSYNYSLKRKLTNFDLIFSDNEVISKYVNHFLKVRQSKTSRIKDSEIAPAKKSSVQELFRDVYYSKKSFLFPIFLLWFITLIGTMTIFLKMNFNITFFREYILKINGIELEIIFGFLGAFLWGINDFLIRKRNIDITPISLHFIWLRMLLASTFGFIIAKMNFIEPISLLLAFSIGGFPVVMTKKFIKGIANKFFAKQTEIKFDEEIEDVDFHDLDGLHYLHAKRFQEENILCNSNLAYCEPVLLYLRTNIEWKVILDLVDQSILYGYVHDDLPKFRKIGVRGAIEAATLYREYIENDSKYAKSAINYISSILKIDENCTIYLLETIFNDLHVQYIWALWDTTVFYDESKMKDGLSQPLTSGQTP